MKNSAWFLILCLWALQPLMTPGIFAQNNDPLPAPLKARIEKAQSIRASGSPEQIYILTDRDLYSAGDTIWLSAWVLTDQTLLPATRSKFLYIDLINPDRQVAQDLVAEIVGGVGNGYFVLSENLDREGIFQICAYTRWNLNFGPEYLFSKTIPVWQKAKEEAPRRSGYQIVVRGMSNRRVWRRITPEMVADAEQAAASATQLADSLLLPDVQFLPEGGKWIAGFPSRVAFKVVGPDGYGVPAEGEIVDQNDSVWVHFSTEHLGMGAFLMVPEAGKTYKARLVWGQEVELPKVQTMGSTLQIRYGKEDNLLITTYSGHNRLTENRPLYLTVRALDHLWATYTVPAGSAKSTLEIAAKDLPGGLVEFTLFDADGRPLSERLVFMDPASREINLSYEAKIVDSPVPDDGSGALLELTLHTRSGLGQKPLSAMVALSVTDTLFAPADTLRATLRSRMLLTSALRGRVENPEYYFLHPFAEIRDRLDLAMLTHGWRSFASQPDTATFIYPPDQNFSVSGLMTDILNKGLKNQRVSLIVQGEYSFAREERSDETGRFSFQELPLTGMSYLTLMAQKENSKRKRFNVGITLDKRVTMEKPSYPEPDLPPTGGETLLAMFNRTKRAEQAMIDSLSRLPGIKYIEEVAITGKRIIPNSYNRNGPGNADIVLDEQQLKKYDRFNSMLDVLRNEVPGFGKGYISPDNLYYTRNSTFLYRPVFSIDERRVSFRVDGENIEQIISEDMAGVDGAVSWYGMNAQFEKLEEALNSISVNDIAGIEVMTSREHIWVYDNLALTMAPLDFKPPCYIEITTKEGAGVTQYYQPTGIHQLRIRGITPQKQYYQPRFIPSDYVDRFVYHRQPTLYWEPALTTGEDGKAKITIPIGRNYKRTLRITADAYNLQGSVGSGQTNIDVGTGKGTW